jgi:predicted glycosyltransferase
MGTTLRIVCYAVNGSGVGHLTRLVGIARWMRRYASLAGVTAEVWFLTTSEADGMLFAEGFPSFKLPSKTSVDGAGIDKVAYLALAKQWMWHSLGLLRPDLFVVDTFPRGSFGELLSAVDLCRSRAFVYRPTKDAFAERPEFQAMLPLYDAIVVPEDERHGQVLVPEAVKTRVTYTGPVLARDGCEAMPREEARRVLGVPEGATAVYVSAGGGGDPDAESMLHAVVDALERDSSLYAIVAAGPLYRGRPRYGPRLAWVTSARMPEMLPACDLAVSAAGYNSFHELLHAGIPTAFLPQEKIADEQHARARRAEAAGAAVVATSPEEALAALERFRDRIARQRASEAARALVPASRAREAAAELMRLVLPGYEVDAARETLDDATLTATRALDLPIETLASVMRAVEPRGLDVPGTTRRRVVRDLAIDLARSWRDAGLDPRTIEPLAKRLPVGDAVARAQAVRLLVNGGGQPS